LKRAHRFRPQSEDPKASIVGDALVGDQACPEQDPEVTAHDRGGRANTGRELPGPARSLAEQLDHTPPCGVGECDEDGADVVAH
jgi:hypothetical protein